MLRGLVIRQVFIVVDVVLGVLVLVACGAAAFSLFPGGQTAQAVVKQPSIDLEDGPQLAALGLRTDYDAIVNSGLFGGAGKAAADEPAPQPVEPQEVVEETALNLRLLSTLATYPTDPGGSALIENQVSQREVTLVAMNEFVLPNVRLLEVHPRAVLIENGRDHDPAKQEWLRMDEPDKDGASTPRPRPAVQANNANEPPARVFLNRQEIYNEINNNYAQLLTQVKPEFVRDDSGQVVGLTAQNISNLPLARKLNLQDGDVLQSINNEAIDSQQKIYEIMMKYQNASSFRVGIQRGGRPHVITYRVR